MPFGLEFSRMFRRLFGARRPDAPIDPPVAPPAVDPPAERDPAKEERQARAAAWVEAYKAGLLHPPANVRDAAGWDTYWRNHLKFGMEEQALMDHMASDKSLPPFLDGRGARTILCVGNGFSYEAISLAILGFEVTALDISRVPMEVIEATLRDPQHPLRQMVGFSLREDGAWTLEKAVDPALGAPLHKSSGFPPRAGGSLILATGDLMDPEICRGPFDVVIERRTVQLFRDGAQEALDHLTRRLATPGTFVSHNHDGGWRPGKPRVHHAEEWLRSHGFEFPTTREGQEVAHAPRVARLVYTSG